MIVKIAIIRQYVVKTLIVIGEATVLWAIALTIEPSSIVVAQQTINVEDASTSATIEKIQVQGYTIFSAREIEEIIKPYRGRQLDFERLRNITEAITELYVSRGYITSGAYLPEQEIVDGRIDIRVVEGQLEDIKIEGLKNLQAKYVRSFISSTETSEISNPELEQSPLNIKDLEEELNLLKRDPSIENIEAELVRGTAPNLSVLLIEVEETSPYEAKLSFDNYRSPSVGEFQGTVQTGYRNLIGVSDRAFAQYNLTEGFRTIYSGWRRYGSWISSKSGGRR